MVDMLVNVKFRTGCINRTVTDLLNESQEHDSLEGKKLAHWFSSSNLRLCSLDKLQDEDDSCSS